MFSNEDGVSGVGYERRFSSPIMFLQRPKVNAFGEQLGRFRAALLRVGPFQADDFLPALRRDEAVWQMLDHGASEARGVSKIEHANTTLLTALDATAADEFDEHIVHHEKRSFPLVHPIGIRRPEGKRLVLWLLEAFQRNGMDRALQRGPVHTEFNRSVCVPDKQSAVLTRVDASDNHCSSIHLFGSRQT